MDYLFDLLLVFDKKLSQTQLLQPRYITYKVPKNFSTKEKKERFLYLIVPPAQNVHRELMQRFKKVKKEIKEGKKVLK